MRRTLVLFAHIFFIVTPILIGWGITDLPSFLREPARPLLLFAIAIGALTILLLKIDLNPIRTGAPAARYESHSLLALTMAAVTLLGFLPYADRHRIAVIHHPFVRWAGLAMVCTGGFVRVLALRQLGPQFSAYVTLQPHHQLVETGIYSMIRHPLYLSLLLAGPGVAFLFASQFVWPILVASIVFVAHRIRAEESLLASHFGDQFERYRLNSRALIPLLW